MRTLVARIYDHHRWASVSLLEACLALTPEQLELTTPGTFGTIGATLDHVVRNHERFLAALRTGEDVHFRPAGGLPPVAELRDRMAAACDGIRELAATMDPEATIAGDRDGEPATVRAWVLIAQAVDHVSEHRAHVGSILGAHGLPTPDLDVWAYEEALERD